VFRRPEEWEQIIGEQVKTLRIQKNFKQEELASRAKVSKSALCNLENGKGSTVKTLVSVLNALGETAWIESLTSNSAVSPIDILKLSRPRQRVR